MHVARERPWWRDGDTGILDALVEEVGIFDKRGNKFAVFYFDDRVLSEESAARAEFVVILEQYEEGSSLIVLCCERLDEFVGDLDFLLGVGLEWKQFGDFFKNVECMECYFCFM